MTKNKGCLECKYLKYYIGYFEESGDDGFGCNFRDADEIERIKSFPAKRKLKCFVKYEEK